MASPEKMSVTVSQKLGECGLDPSYWLGVLRAFFDITSLDQVGELGNEAVDQLARCKQSESDIEALKQFIASSRISNIGFIEKQMDKSKRNHDRVSLLLNKLIELNGATEPRSEIDVKQKADELFQALDIPQHNWLKEFDKDAVATATDCLLPDLSKLNQFLLAKNDLTMSAQVLDNTSGGLALGGILHTGEIGYQRCPGKLLSACCQPRVSAPDKHQEIFEVEHTSQKDFQEFNETLQVSKFNIGSKINAGNSGGGSTESSADRTVMDVHYSKTICILFPTMRVDFRETESCLLSTEALEELKRIDKLVAEGADEQVKSKCNEFLKMFGSHYYLNYIMGGILKLDVVYSNSLPSGLPHREMVDIVNGVYNAFNSSCFVGPLPPLRIEGFMNEEKMKKLGLGGIYDPSVLSKLSIHVGRSGGLGGVDSIPLWKASLGLGSDICSVVESDPPKICAIWDLLPQKCFSDIHHSQKIADHLLQAWQRTSIPADHSQLPALSGHPITQTSVSSKKEVAGAQIENAESHNPCCDLLSLLGLSEYYPQKITLKQVVSISDGQEEKEQLTLHDIPWVILKKILMIDYEGRNTAWERRLPDPNMPDDPDDQTDGMNNLDDSLAYLDDQGNDIPHPTDIFLATFRCCDMTLCQVLLEKMTMCRLSVPLVMPGSSGSKPTLCRWALRSVVLEYSRRPGPVAETTPSPMVEFALVDCPMKVASFVRIGEIPISKSQLLNRVLSVQGHHTFFNNESCTLGTSDRSISNGMIEAAWYIPNKRDEGLFDDVTMFLDLRGDAAKFPQLARLISTMSSVVVVFVDIKDLDGDSSVAAVRTLYQNQQKFVLVLTGTPNKGCLQHYGELVGEEIRSATTKTIITTSKGKQQKALNEIGHGIRKNLSIILKKGSAKTYDELSKLVMECDDGMSIDEDDEACQQGKALAEKVTRHMQNTPVAEIKQKQLPMQQLYPDWSALLKKRNRAKGKKHKEILIEENEKLHQQMKEVRDEQCKKGLTPMIETFITALIELIDAPTKLQLFLQWLKLFFDKLSRDNLPQLKHKYRRRWAAFNAAKGKSADQELSELKKEMEDAEKELAEASCGLEHLFREVGQLYEASKESKLGLPYADDQIVDKLPEVAAKLLLLGHPIELMDGDAANVPLTWVKEVLNSLAFLKGGKKVFILSVLGIQSSGKSTLLNTMFGLRFTVSAGRCTRGVYAQLVEVDKSKTALPIDYVLVVDTEGLRAPELKLDKHEHDNELATFTIGVSDVVIINIKGESVTEMEDVLQIAVHAFLRMKCVELHKQTCVFIHQNVSDPNAKEKMVHGKQKLLDSLNEMTYQAAQLEQRNDLHLFSQIINIDIQNWVWYFADLWHGNPPMAPSNPGYSESVETVRNCLLFDIVKKEKADFLVASYLKNRISDLWHAILADDFVFSFRNSLAVKAYSELEDKYHEVIWVMKKDVMEWFFTVAQNKLERCESEDTLGSTTPLLLRELEVKVDDLSTKQKEELEHFFDQNSLKDITIQWSAEKLFSMEIATSELLTRTKRDIMRKRDHLVFELRNRAAQELYDENILAKASELADEMKGNPLTDEKLYSKFSDMWAKWLTTTPPIDKEEVRIVAEVENVLFEEFGQQRQLVRSELEVNSLTCPLVGPLRGTFTIEEDDISYKLNENAKKIDYKETIQQALHLTENVFETIEVTLNNLSSQCSAFQFYHATEVVLRTVFEFVEKHNHENSDRFKFTFLPKYKVRLAVHVCRRAMSTFTAMREEYNKKHSPAAKLDLMKSAAFNLFKNKVRKCAIEVTAAGLFCDRLAGLIKHKIRESMAWNIFEEVYNDFSKKKYHLIVAILEDLAGREGFDKDWEPFLNDSKTYALKWITRYINKKCFSPENREGGSYASIAGSALDKLIKGISDSVHVASEHALHQPSSGGGSINEWMQKFCNVAEDYIAVRETQMNIVAELGVENIDCFELRVMKRLDETKKLILKDFFAETEEMKWEGKTPYQLLMDKIWGCGAQCPFCKEPCQWTDADHCEGTNKVSHRCIQHRSKGLGSYRWDIGAEDEGHLCLESCSYSIQANETFRCQKQLPTCKGDDEHHPYREYKTYYLDWDIAPSPTMESSKFWMWVMATYKKELAKLYHAKEAKIPHSWTEITKEEALRSLRENR